MDAQYSLSLSNSGLVGIYLVLARCVIASILANLYPGYRYKVYRIEKGSTLAHI
jgi:hypothetical protein